MGYSSQTISGYNSTPPDDDGSQTEANRVYWSTIKSKLGDPIKTLAEGVNSAMVSFAATRFGNSVETFSDTKTLDGNDEGTVQVFTGSTAKTATLPSAATVGSDWVVNFVNNGSAVLTIDGDGSETINGSTTKTLGAGQSVILVSDGSNWYLLGTDPSQVNPTGMIAPFHLSAAPNGWVALNRSSIGDSGSGADDASADNENLFLSLHGSLSDTQAPVIEASGGWQTITSVSTGSDTLTITSHGLLSNAKVVLIDGGSATAPTGLLFNRVYYVISDTSDTFKLSATSGPGSAVDITGAGSGTLKIAEVSKGTAATDFSGGKLMIMPDYRGRAVIGAGTGTDGSGGSLTARSLGAVGGAETVTLTTSEIPDHEHTLLTDEGAGASDATITGSEYLQNQNLSDTDTNKQYDLKGTSTTADTGKTGGVVGSPGSGHANMQPWTAALWCIKK